MIQFRKLLIRFLFIAIVFLIIVQFAEATALSFTVKAGQNETRSLSLVVEDRVSVRFTVVGPSDSALYFYMTYPNGTTKEFGNVGILNYAFVCDAEGEYVLHFVNTDSTEDKLVTLDYEIQHYIFGIPQMLFLVIIVVLVCVAAVAVFIFMGKPR